MALPSAKMGLLPAGPLTMTLCPEADEGLELGNSPAEVDSKKGDRSCFKREMLSRPGEPFHCQKQDGQDKKTGRIPKEEGLAVFPKDGQTLDSPTFSGRLFHSCIPWTEKALSPPLSDASY